MDTFSMLITIFNLFHSWGEKNRTFVSWLTAKCIALPAIPQFQLKKKQMRNVNSWGIEPQLSACKAEMLTIITKNPNSLGNST